MSFRIDEKDVEKLERRKKQPKIEPISKATF